MSGTIINYNNGRTTTRRKSGSDYEQYDLERRRRARAKKERQIAKQRMAILVASIMLVIIGCVIFGSIFSSAHVNEADQELKYYKSIEIQKGDTLWNIAKEYKSDIYYKDIQAYVDEIKEVNGLTSDTIHEGQHLIVAYYDVIEK